MARWEPDARGRLLRAALELFTEHGYEATTAAQIAEHAGLTKTTLFRHFVDKREILFQGQPMLVSVVTAGVHDAPAGADALDLARAGVAALCDTHVVEQQEIGRQIELLVAGSIELQERTAFKRSILTAALEAALAERLGDAHLSGALADLTIRAYYRGFTAWADVRRNEPLLQVVLDELRALERALHQALGSVDRMGAFGTHLPDESETALA